VTDHENRSNTTVLFEHISQVFLELFLKGGLYNSNPLLREQSIDDFSESATEVKPVSRKFPGIALDNQQVGSGLAALFDLPRATLRPRWSRTGFST
jgi:hypothetical protein